MWDIGYLIDSASLICAAFILLGFQYLKVGKSEQAALTVWVISNVVMQLVTDTIYALCVEFIQYSYIIWYGSWILTNFVALGFILYLHQSEKLAFSKLAGWISLSFLLLQFVQVIGFVDRAILETRAVDDIYSFSVLFCNLSVVPLALYYLVKAFGYTRIRDL